MENNAGTIFLNTQPYPQVWLALLVVVATASVVQAQFRFPLPSPPRILFGGFRPLFSRPRPRPRPRPPVLVPANQFLQQQVSLRLGEVGSANLKWGLPNIDTYLYCMYEMLDIYSCVSFFPHFPVFLLFA